MKKVKQFKKCPQCGRLYNDLNIGSEKVKKISTMKRATHMHLFGFFRKLLFLNFVVKIADTNGDVMKEAISKKIKANKKSCILSGIVLFAVIVYVLFLIVISPPNLRLNDFDTENGKIATLWQMGIPTKANDEIWEYDNCGIKFYGINVVNMTYDISTGKYCLIVEDLYKDDVEDVISKHCDFLGFDYLTAEYRYDNLYVTLSYDDDFCYINIE